MTKYFGTFRLDVDEGTLWRGAEPVALTNKASALLRCLIVRAGTWVSKTTIMSEVWPDTHVQPDNVKVLVREIRQALGDGSRNSQFIKSAPGRGYSFVAQVSVSSGAGWQGRSASSAPVFVNRGPEQAILADALDAARASSRRLMLVRGEHGAGKTTLCDAFLRTAHAAGPLRACVGQCFARELPHEPYYPFLDALMALDRRHPGLVPKTLAANAPSWLAQFPQWLNAPTPTVHAVRMFDELSAALEALSSDLPLVVVLEDIEWADADTINALVRLAESRVPSKLMILATCCDGDWAAGARVQQRLLSVAKTLPHALLSLGTLTLEHTARYLDARFGPGCLSDLAATVHNATGGNPFMMVNAIDSLVARQLVVDRGQGWQREATIDAIALALPDTFGDVIARHVDLLAPTEREALEAAAAVGLEFTVEFVSFAMQQSPDYVRQQLTPLARRGHLIAATQTNRSARVPQTFRFRHSLYADLIAQQAPMLRQLRVVERINRAKEDERSLQDLRRA